MRELRAGAAIIVLALVVAACGDTAPTPAPSGSTAPDASVTAESAPPASAPVAEASPEPVRPSTSPLPRPTSSRTRSSRPPSPSTRRRRSARRPRTRPARSTSPAGRATSCARDATGKSKATVETITGNGTRYVKVKGVWTNAGPADETDLVAVLRGMTGVTDLGVEDKDGAQLHHLQTPALGVIPRDLALVTKDVTDVTATVDAWVRRTAPRCR